MIEDNKAELLGVKNLSSIDGSKIDFIIAMGEDGTILRIAQTYQNLSAPILGINLGHLGFVADIPTADIYPSLQDLLAGKYTIEKRLDLEAKAESGTLFAVNDIVRHRGQN